MPKTPDTEFTSRAGVYYTGYACSMAGIIFRETPNTDVGIDGQIELVDDENKATGMMAGIQVKSGDSFVDPETKTFTFRAERKHFEYWKRFCLPVIGIVFSPTLMKAAWFDLSKYSKVILSEEKPLEIKEILNRQNELEPLNGIPSLVRCIKEYHGFAVYQEDVDRIAHIQEEPEEDTEIDRLDKVTAWKRLVTIFFASDSAPDVIADVGYRLSWYFPSVADERREFFIGRIVRVTDEELVRIVGAVHQALIDDRDDVANLIIDLIRYLPKHVVRLNTLEQSNLIPADQLWVLNQVIECLSE
jgi:Domain of unknown function (DUF4365)